MAREHAMDHERHFCSTLDMVDRDTTLAARGYLARAALLNRAFWGRGARLTVGFLEGSVQLQRRVAQIAAHWPKDTGADFDFEFWIEINRDPRDANIRIAFKPDKGSWSQVGRYALAVKRDEPTMNLGWMTTELVEDKAQAVVLHEFGHAIGLIHEHLNPSQLIDWNVGNVVSDLRRTQGWDDETIQANMFARYSSQEVFATDVDPQSIMMYPIPPRWTNNGFSTDFNSGLTEKDKLLILEAYGRSGPFGAR
jgi:hypothetical protein